MPRRRRAAAGAADEQPEDDRVAGAVKPLAAGQARVEPKGVARQTQPPDAERGGIVHQDAEHHRMQVQMQMAVDVIQRQAGGVEPFKLRVDFARAMARASRARRNNGSPR